MSANSKAHSNRSSRPGNIKARVSPRTALPASWISSSRASEWSVRRADTAQTGARLARFVNFLGLLPACAPPLLLPAQAATGARDLNEILFWGGALVFAMLLLFVVQKVLRHVIQSRVHSIHTQSGIQHDDLDRMERTGLLSEEERKRVQEAIVRNLTRETREAAESELRRHAEATRSKTDSLTPEAIRKAVEEENARRGPLVPPPPPRLGGGSVPPAPSPARDLAASAPPRRPRPSVDLDSLLARGLITPEEYERLRKVEDEPS